MPKRVEYLPSGKRTEYRALLPYLLLEFDNEGRLTVMILPTSDGAGEDRFSFFYQDGKLVLQEYLRSHPDDSYSSTRRFIYLKEERSILSFEGDSTIGGGTFPQGVYNFDLPLDPQYIPPDINKPGNLNARESWFLFDQSGRPIRSVRILAYVTGFSRYIRDYRYDSVGRINQVRQEGNTVLQKVIERFAYDAQGNWIRKYQFSAEGDPGIEIRRNIDY